jgi:aspartyl-tRNA(Asn)/glutamyl-tRNA(Gln) amidotransferase subunit A
MRDVPHRQPLAVIARRVNSGATNVADGVHASMSDIVNGESGPNRLNAFISFDYEGARSDAMAIDARREVGTTTDATTDATTGATTVTLPLAGVPVAVKDNICTLGLPTTCGSRLLAGYASPFEATVVRRLRAAGAVVVGKTNLDEFGMGSSTENSAFGHTRNPRDLQRVPGGSSGGSAAAVAAGWVPAALGSDTGGSVRQPAAFCGVVGIKPSYGRVSRYGLVAYASSLDQVGVFGRSVIDAALLLQVIAGVDPRDATSGDVAVPDLVAAAEHAAAQHCLAGTVIGVPDEYFGDGIDAGVRAACEGALSALARLGAEVRRVSLPHTQYAVPAYYVIAPAEASSNLARYDGVRFGSRAAGAATAATVMARTRAEGLGAEVKRRIMLGTYALSAGYQDRYYGTAQRVRTMIRRDFERVFDSGVDVIFTPTTPTAAFRLGEKVADPYAMYLSDVFTVPANLAELPALSLPVGTSAGLPVGGQLMARRWCESVMIGVASALEQALEL